MSTNPHIEQPDDHLLFDLFDKIPLEKAPVGFTEGIMQQVYSGYEPLAESPEYRRQMIWAYFAIGAALIIFIIMFFAQLPFLNISIPTDTGYLRNLLHAGLGFFDGFTSLLTYLKGSSTMLIIFFSLTILLIIERIFRKGIYNNNFFSL
ncbi:MAG: hypothetical protein IPH20_16855 [Bacteroidales bacterium]|nr:hypothetical protein [Bacteroidales bacterium]